MDHSCRVFSIIASSLAILALSGCGGAPSKPDLSGYVYPKPPDPPRFYYERTLLGTGSLIEQTEKDRFRTMVTGEQGRVGVAFQKPFDVAVHKGRLFITDTVARVVHVLDFTEQKWFQIGDKGDEGDLRKPLGIAVDETGQVYVVDATAKSVKVYDRDGNYQRDIGDKSIFSRPSGIDASADGARLYVVDTGGVDRDDSHRILVLDANSGRLLRHIGNRGKGPGQLNLARDVALGPNGLLYVTDGGNFRVQAFTQEGGFAREWGQPGRYAGQFSRPKGIATDNDGNVYVVDAAFGNFQIFDAEGQLLMFIGERSTQPGPGKYMLPAGIDVDEDGRIYLVEQFFRKVDVFRPAALAPEGGYLGQSKPAE